MFKSQALVLMGCASLLFATGCVNTAMIADDAATSANKPFFFNSTTSGANTGTILARKSDVESGGGKATPQPYLPGAIDSRTAVSTSANAPGSGAMPMMPGLISGTNPAQAPGANGAAMQGVAMPAMPGMMMPPMMPGPMMSPMMPPMMPPMLPGPMMSAATLSAPMPQMNAQQGMASPFVPAAYGIGPNSALANQQASAQQPNFNRPIAGMPNAAAYSNTPSLNYPTGPAVGANGMMPLGSYSQFVRPTGAVYQITDVSNEPDLASAGSSSQTTTAGKETREKARATGDVFMRTGPGKSYKTKGVVKRGEVASVEFCEGKWCKITVNGTTGYSSARFLSFFKE